MSTVTVYKKLLITRRNQNKGYDNLKNDLIQYYKKVKINEGN